MVDRIVNVHAGIYGRGLYAIMMPSIVGSWSLIIVPFPKTERPNGTLCMGIM